MLNFSILRKFIQCYQGLQILIHWRHSPFLTDEIISELKDELPAYLARCADTDDSVCPLDWWKRNSTDLPKWSAAAAKVLLIQPSSAATERVFSLLKASFSEQQDHSLQDYIEASLMFLYNYH